MRGRFDKVAFAVLFTVQSAWLTTLKPVASQNTTPTLRRLKPIMDTSDSSSTSSTSSSSSSSSPSSLSNPYNTPTNAPAYGQYNSAAGSTTYGTAQSTKSQRIDNLMSQALQAHAGGNSAAAENLFRQVLSLDHKNIDAYYNLGVIAEERGDYKEAMQNYQSGLRIDSSDQDLKSAYSSASQKLQQLTYTKQQATAQAQEQAKLAQQTDQLKLLGAQAASAYHAGKYDAAIKDLQTIASQRPNDPDVQYALAQAYRQKKDYMQATDHINRAIAIVPSNPQYRQLLSGILAEKNGRTSPSQLSQGMPPAAPQYSRGDYNDYYSGNSATGSNAGNNDQASAAKGQIVPFTPDVTEPPPGSPASAWAQGGENNGGYYNSGYSSPSRIRRMLTGALVGATAGGLMGSMFHPRYYGYGGYGGYGSSYMMSGALWGGMAGLIFGGMR